MDKLIAELTRLYLPGSATAPAAWTRHFAGAATLMFDPVLADGLQRTIAIAFDKQASGDEGAHWKLLCLVANALQQDLGLPAPAVSVSGDRGFILWLSLAQAAPQDQVQLFLNLLAAKYYPQSPDLSASAPFAPPPCLKSVTGKWAAFINPGLGASFSEDCGLEMPPPLAGQIALLENLTSISEQQFGQALQLLGHENADLSAPAEPAAAQPAGAGTPSGVLLKNATLEDIVAHLHALGIEPSFRHLLRK